MNKRQRSKIRKKREIERAKKQIAGLQKSWEEYEFAHPESYKALFRPHGLVIPKGMEKLEAIIVQ